jgi:hypothetical protein
MNITEMTAYQKIKNGVRTYANPADEAAIFACCLFSREEAHDYMIRDAYIQEQIDAVLAEFDKI